MAKLDYTKAQDQAINTLDKSIVVVAGAGAGKTRVLVDRYLKLITEGKAKIEEIVAITFTNKAAKEMMERIRKKFDADFSKARIGTFHNLCGNLLRENPVEAGLDPRFKVLSEVECQIILQQALQESLLEGLDKKDKAIIAVVDEYGLKYIKKHYPTLINRVRSNGMNWTQVEEITINYYDGIPKEWKRVLEEITSLIKELTSLENLKNAALRDIEELRSLESRVLEDIKLSSFEDSKPIASLEEIKNISGKAKDIKESFSTLKEKINILELLKKEVRNKDFSFYLIHLAKEAEKVFQREKERLYSLDYEDLQVKALQLLKENKEVLEGYRKKLKYIMVDEFQDTNQIQFELVSLLVGDFSSERLFVVGDPKQSIYKFRGADVSLFAKVKDQIKAAGGIEVFLKENFRSKEKVIDFVNQVFEKLMGDATNPFDVQYEKIKWEKPSKEKFPHIELLVVEEEESTANEGEDPAKGDGLESLEVVLEESLQEKEARLLALRIKELIQDEEQGMIIGEENRKLEYKDIALLFRATGNMKIYESVFQEMAIPYYIFGGSGFYQKQEIKDIINLLKALNDPNDNLALAGALRSPFFALSDESLYWLVQRGKSLARGFKMPYETIGLKEEEKDKLAFAQYFFGKYQQLQSRYTIYDYLRLILEETEYQEMLLAQFMGKQKWANVQKFKSLANSLGDQSFFTLQDFLLYLNTLIEGEARETQASIEREQGNTVKFMTVHSSKGLEFPVVVIPDCGRQFNTSKDSFLFDLDYGIGFKRRGPKGEISEENLLRKLVADLDKAKEISECKRLFYVAITRAEDYIIFAGVNKQAKEEKFDPDNDWDNMKSWMQWMCKLTGKKEYCQGALPLYGGIEVKTRVDIKVRDEKPKPLIKLYPQIKEFSTGINLVLGQASNLSEEMKDFTQQIEGLKDEGRESIIYSVSPIMTYQACPRRFYYQYRTKLPSDKRLQIIEEESEGQSTKEDVILMEDAILKEEEVLLEEFFLPATKKGHILHKLCERLVCREDLDVLLENILLEEGIFRKEEQEKALQEVLPLAKNYMNSEFFEHTTGVVKNELPFLLKIEQNLFLTGIIDRVVFKDDVLEVIDFKSNWVTKDNLKEVAKRYEIQLQLYAKAVEEIYGLKVEKAQLYFLTPDLTYEIDISTKKVETTLIEVKEMMAKMELSQGREEFTRTQQECDKCYYRGICI